MRNVVVIRAAQSSLPTERALLPHAVLSQTVPLIAIAPLVAGWGGKIAICGDLTAPAAAWAG